MAVDAVHGAAAARPAPYDKLRGASRQPLTAKEHGTTFPSSSLSAAAPPAATTARAGMPQPLLELLELAEAQRKAFAAVEGSDGGVVLEGKKNYVVEQQQQRTAQQHPPRSLPVTSTAAAQGSGGAMSVLLAQALAGNINMGAGLGLEALTARPDVMVRAASGSNHDVMPNTAVLRRDNTASLLHHPQFRQLQAASNLPLLPHHHPAPPASLHIRGGGNPPSSSQPQTKPQKIPFTQHDNSNSDPNPGAQREGDGPSAKRIVTLLQCRYCPRTFQHSSNRTRHEAIHTGNEPLEFCPMCKSAFVKRSSLQKHKRHCKGEGPAAGVLPLPASLTGDDVVIVMDTSHPPLSSLGPRKSSAAAAKRNRNRNNSLSSAAAPYTKPPPSPSSRLRAADQQRPAPYPARTIKHNVDAQSQQQQRRSPHSHSPSFSLSLAPSSSSSGGSSSNSAASLLNNLSGGDSSTDLLSAAGISAPTVSLAGLMPASSASGLNVNSSSQNHNHNQSQSHSQLSALHSLQQQQLQLQHLQQLLQASQQPLAAPKLGLSGAPALSSLPSMSLPSSCMMGGPMPSLSESNAANDPVIAQLQQLHQLQSLQLQLLQQQILQQQQQQALALHFGQQ